MSTTTTTKLGDEFLRVPKLDVAGTNWVIYKDRFLWSIDARGYLDHLDGTASAPPDPIVDRTSTMVLTSTQVAEDAAWKVLLKPWKQGEAVVKQQIAGTIPDSLFMKIRGKDTAKDIWEALAGDFQKKSRMVSVDFSKLRTMREDLAAMGHTPSQDDFYAIILGSLPSSFDPYISAVNATSSVLGTNLSSDDLMLTVTEEYERRLLKSKSGKKDDRDVAFYSSDSSRGKGRGGNSNSGGLNFRKDKECFNEGERRKK